jgi:alcohol dehydrogenase
LVLRPPFRCPVAVYADASLEEVIGPAIGDRSWALVTSRSWAEKKLDRRIAAAASDPVAVISRVDPNPMVSGLPALSAEVPDVDVIVALGGGSVLDAAKGMVALKALDGDLGPLEAHLGEGAALPSRMRPISIIAVPTTSGTGSEVTPWGTLWGDDGTKFSINDPRLYPSHAILDPALTLSMPAELTLSTALDAVSHALEAIWNRRNTLFSDGLAVRAVAMVYESLPVALEQPNDLPARQALQTAALTAGLAMGTTQTALAHSISYPFTSRFGVAHGIACSFTLAEIARFNQGEDSNRLASVATALNCAPDAVPDTLQRWLIELGVGEILARHLSVDDIDSFGDSLITPARAANNLRHADGEVARRLARRAFETLTAG